MTSETLTAEPFISGLLFGECPRWHDGRLWFSDFYDRAVLSVSPEGDRRVEVAFDGEPAGLGWLPDGRLLINSRLDRAVMRREEDGTIVRHGTLTPWATWHANDMVVAANGQAYAGNFGFDLDGLYDGSLPAGAIRSTSIVRVDPDGSSCEAASDLAFPNGAVITPDGATLIVAESMGGRLSAFDRAADGTLGNRREWAAPARRRCPTASACARTTRSGWRTRWHPSASGSPRAVRSSSACAPRRTATPACSATTTDGPSTSSPWATATTPRRRRPAAAPSRRSARASPAPGSPEAYPGGLAGYPSFVRAPRRLRTACPMRFSFSMSAKRTWPSPPGPKPTPGEVATSASLTRYFENSRDPISR